MVVGNPKVFLGEKVFLRLFPFLRGYYDRRAALGVYAEFDFDVSLYGLTSWMTRRYNISLSHNVFELIELYADCGDDAFVRLAEVLREYLEVEHEFLVKPLESQQQRWTEGVLNRTDLIMMLERRAWICGGAHIQHLRSYLDGDFYAIKEVCGGQTRVTPSLQEFESWLMRTYSLGVRCDWTKVMLLLSNGDPVRAYEGFFELLSLSMQSDDGDQWAG